MDTQSQYSFKIFTEELFDLIDKNTFIKGHLNKIVNIGTIFKLVYEKFPYIYENEKKIENSIFSNALDNFVSTLLTKANDFILDCKKRHESKQFNNYIYNQFELNQIELTIYWLNLAKEALLDILAKQITNMEGIPGPYDDDYTYDGIEYCTMYDGYDN
jgi:hypothetical protein